MFIDILRLTPVWVRGLPAALVALRLSHSRDREMSLLRLTIPLLAMLALSASGVFSAFGHAPVAIGGWGAGLAAALTLGRHVVGARGAAWMAGSAKLRGRSRAPRAA